MTRTVQQIVRDGGGATEVARACGVHPAKPAGWYKNGVEWTKWRVLMRLAGATAEEMLSACEAARNGARPVRPEESQQKP